MTVADPAVVREVHGWWGGPVPPEPIRPNPVPPPEWSIEDAALVAWFLESRDRIPAAPFELSRGVFVTDREAFLAALDRDVARGPGGPRRRVLGEELAALRSACCRP